MFRELYGQTFSHWPVWLYESLASDNRYAWCIWLEESRQLHTPCVILSLDVENALDRLDRKYLWAVLRSLSSRYEFYMPIPQLWFVQIDLILILFQFFLVKDRAVGCPKVCSLSPLNCWLNAWDKTQSPPVSKHFILYRPLWMTFSYT